MEKQNNKNLEKNDDKAKTSNSEAISDIISNEVLEALPIEERGRVQSMMIQTMASGVMRSNNPISEKITSEHISKLIENSGIQDERDRKERKSEKNYQIIFLLIGLIFLGFLIVFLKDDKELLYKVIIAIISFIGGFGIGKNTNKRKNGED